MCSPSCCSDSAQQLSELILHFVLSTNVVEQNNFFLHADMFVLVAVFILLTSYALLYFDKL